MPTTPKMKSYTQQIAERLNIDTPEDPDNFVQVREWLNANSNRYIEYQRQHGQMQGAANAMDEYQSLSPKDAPDNKAAKEPLAPKDFDHFFAESKDGKEVFYRWRDSARAAFSDHGDHIQIHDKSPENQEAIIAASLAIAKERAWKEIEVTGDQDFRRKCWMEANLAGIQCRGYTPTPDDRLTLEQMRPGSAPTPAEPAPEAKIAAVEHDHKLVQQATEKREANGGYQPSLEELNAIDRVLIQKQKLKNDPMLAINGEPAQPITAADLAKEERKERDMDAMGVTHRIHELKGKFADLKPTERKTMERIEGQNRGNDLAADTSRQTTGPGR